MGLVTFHKILRGCEDGIRESWRLFLTDYSPIVFHLAAVYLPNPAGLGKQVWRDVLQALTSNDFERLRSLDHQAEREFLLDLRALFLDCGVTKLDPSRDFAQAQPPALDRVRELLKDLPLLHQQVMFTKLAGYSDATIEQIYTITPAVAAQSLERLKPQYAALLGREQDVCLWPAAWTQLVHDARASKTESCPPARQYVRMLDGQSSWYDKGPLEQHMSTCLHCLERWTALREITYWRREAKPRPQDEIHDLLSGLPTRTTSSAGRAVLKRIFGSGGK